MGAWGVAIFSDDLAADIRSDFRELIGDGLTPSEATDRLKAEYASSLVDPDEMPVFWIALALAQWKLGRLEERTKEMALQVIDDGTDLARWNDAKSRVKREVVLAKTRAELLSASPPPKRVPRAIREANQWHLGETIGFQLLSGKWTMFRVIGHHVDKGGRFAVCELLNWVGEMFPSKDLIAELRIRKRMRHAVYRSSYSRSPAKRRSGHGSYGWVSQRRHTNNLAVTPHWSGPMLIGN